jgi:DNA polymerase III delta prime subunit
MFNNLWVEKYRPKTLDEMVLSPENRNYFSSLKGEVPNLLFVGTPGIGKTTIAKIIVQDILQCQYLYINASDENGIDTIRSKVSGFSQVKSIDGNIKIVILDEADGITIDGQRALRNTMEEYSAYTRFILTANYKHKIIPAIQSRTQYFDLNPNISDVVSRVLTILKAENITIPATEKTNLVKVIKDNFPDIRKTINTIQKYCVTGTLQVTNNINTKGITSEIHEFIKSNKLIDLRKYLIENESDFQSDYSSVLKGYLNFLYESDVKDDKKREAIIVIAEYLYRDALVLDKEINAYACFLNLSKLIA